jgi:hypothetical protein
MSKLNKKIDNAKYFTEKLPAKQTNFGHITIARDKILHFPGNIYILIILQLIFLDINLGLAGINLIYLLQTKSGFGILSLRRYGKHIY